MARFDFEIHSPSGSTTHANLESEALDRVTIRKRFVKNAGTTFGLAFLSIFLPIAHFFLVPGLLVATVIIGRRSLNAHMVVKSGTINCPQCHRDFEVRETYCSIPLKIDCERCGLALTVRSKAA